MKKRRINPFIGWSGDVEVTHAFKCKLNAFAFESWLKKFHWTFISSQNYGFTWICAIVGLARWALLLVGRWKACNLRKLRKLRSFRFSSNFEPFPCHCTSHPFVWVAVTHFSFTPITQSCWNLHFGELTIARGSTWLEMSPVRSWTCRCSCAPARRSPGSPPWRCAPLWKRQSPSCEWSIRQRRKEELLRSPHSPPPRLSFIQCRSGVGGCPKLRKPGKRLVAIFSIDCRWKISPQLVRTLVTLGTI